MEYTIDRERTVYENGMGYVGCYDSKNSDDLRLARGMFNGFIIQLISAAFVVAIIAVI